MTRNPDKIVPDPTAPDPEQEMSLDELRAAAPEILRGWIKGQLLGYGHGPQAIAPLGGGVIDGIISILSPRWDEERRVRVSEAIGPLISDWRETTDTKLDYLANLLRLVSGLDLTPPNAVFDHLDGNLKKRLSSQGDLHELALGAALNSFREETKLIYILKRDLKDPAYTAICANALLERAPYDAPNFMPDLLNIGTQHNLEVDLGSLLVTAVRKMTAKNFLNSFRRGLVMSSKRHEPEYPYIDMDSRKKLVEICMHIPEIDVDTEYDFRLLPTARMKPRGSKGYKDSIVVVLSPEELDTESKTHYDEITKKEEAEYPSNCLRVQQSIHETIGFQIRQ